MEESISGIIHIQKFCWLCSRGATNHFKEKIILPRKQHGVPEAPPVTLPSQQKFKQLRTKITKIDGACRRKEEFKRWSHVNERQYGGAGVNWQVCKNATVRLKMDANLMGQEIEQLWMCEEENGTTILQWCQGILLQLRLGTEFTLNGVKIAYMIVTCQGIY